MTSVDGMDTEIKELAASYRKASGAISKWKQENRPPGMVVYVEAKSYTGFGIVKLEPCSPDLLPVTLENGNTWWYPVEQTWIANRPGNWPNWIQRKKRIPLRYRHKE